jgi:hypothetical protein
MCVASSLGYPRKLSDLSCQNMCVSSNADGTIPYRRREGINCSCVSKELLALNYVSFCLDILETFCGCAASLVITTDKGLGC